MNEPLISVIVPVYNVEQYLHECLDSILNQTYQNIEVLLINDGSTDTSGIICEQYATTSDKIRVFHIYNGGLSHARNIGLENMHGEFVIFVDSDDFLNTNCIEILYNQAIQSNADVTIAFPYRYREADGIFLYYPLDRLNNERLSAQEVIVRMNSNDLVPGWTYWTACWKLFRSHLFKFIRFPKGILYEDAATLPKIFLTSKNIVQIPEALYCYRERTGSIMRSNISVKNAESILYVCRERLHDIVLADLNPSIDYQFQLHHLTWMKGLMEENELSATIEYLQIERQLNLIKSLVDTNK